MGVEFYDSRQPDARHLGTLSQTDAEALLRANSNLANAWGIDMHNDWKLSGAQFEKLIDATDRNTLSDEGRALLMQMTSLDVVYGVGD